MAEGGTQTGIMHGLVRQILVLEAQGERRRLAGSGRVAPGVVPSRSAATAIVRRCNMAVDPVCKMNLEPAKAAARTEYVGRSYYFCSGACHKAFTAEPQRYADPARHGGYAHGPHGRK